MESKKLNFKKEYYYERVKCPLFPVYYNVIVGWDMKNLEKEVEEYYPGLELKLSDQVGYAARISHHEKGEAFVVMIDLNDNREGTVDSTCVHESVHLSWFIMDHVGVEVTHDNHEIQAYLIQELSTQILRIAAIGRSKVPNEQTK